VVGRRSPFPERAADILEGKIDEVVYLLHIPEPSKKSATPVDGFEGKRQKLMALYRERATTDTTNTEALREYETRQARSSENREGATGRTATDGSSAGLLMQTCRRPRTHKFSRSRIFSSSKSQLR
jgi:hypothetical protein